MKIKSGEAARLIGVTTHTLANWRLRGHGPPYVKIGNLIRYDRESVLSWMEQHVVIPGEQDENQKLG